PLLSSSYSGLFCYMSEQMGFTRLPKRVHAFMHSLKKNLKSQTLLWKTVKGVNIFFPNSVVTICWLHLYIRIVQRFAHCLRQIFPKYMTLFLINILERI